MSSHEWIVLLGGQTLIMTGGLIVIYHLLRSKLEKQKSRIDSLKNKQDQMKVLVDHRTGKLLTTVQQMRTSHWQSTSELSELKQLGERTHSLLSQIGNDERRVRIIINTLPKVGSSSIYKTLRAAFPESTVDHTHSVSLEGQMALASDIDTYPQSGVRDSLLGHFHRTMIVRPELDQRQTSITPSDGVYFVCGTREPLSWALSQVFQLLAMGGLPAESGQPANAQRIVMDWFSGRPVWRWTPSPTEWMLREIRGYLGVNPLEMKFDQARGYQVLETKRGRLLLMRQENLDHLPEALAELFSAPTSLFQAEHTHITADKEVGVLYKEVAATLKFPASFVERVYSDPFATTFYSPEERQKFAARWTE